MKGSLYLTEHWPISWGEYRITWSLEEKTVTSISVTVQTSDLSSLPRVEPSLRAGIAANIRIGAQPFHDEVESILRTASGLLSLFTSAEIDFGRPTIVWEAETDEERSRLQMHSWSTEEATGDDPLPLTFDMVARCFLAAPTSSRSEIPLSFLAKGRRDARSGRYIDAYYSFFFFLETQFAPGLSNPRRVSERLKTTAQVRDGIRETRSDLAGAASSRIRQLLELSDEALIDHLVETRGRLHHHALPKKSKTWHPERHGEFKAEVEFISHIVNHVALGQSIPLLFDEAITTRLRKSAEADGVEYVYLVNADGGSDRYGLNGLPQLRISLPTRRPSHTSLWALERGMREKDGPYELMAVRSYDVVTSDGSTVVARYRNHTFPPKPPRTSRPKSEGEPDSR